MSRAISTIIAVATLFSAAAHVGNAGEQLHPLAIGGEWIAFSHSESMIAAPDMCVVANDTSGVSYRATPRSIEFRAFRA